MYLYPGQLHVSFNQVVGFFFFTDKLFILLCVFMFVCAQLEARGQPGCYSSSTALFEIASVA